MSSFKFIPHYVQWYEGMLLKPQHFQQSDLLHRNLLSYHLSQVDPYYWGVVNIEVDSSQLVNGLFRILSLEAILPDGTVIFLPQYGYGTVELNLQDALPDIPDKPVKVYLILPEVLQKEVAGESSILRYESEESEPVLDRNTGDGGIAIARLRPKITLIAGKDVPPRHVGLALGEVEVLSNVYAMTSYIPPQLRVEVRSPIGQMCIGLIQKIREKLGYLQRKIQGTIAQTPEASRIIAEVEEIRRRLVIGLIPLESMVQTNAAHPYDIYCKLIELSAQGVAICRGLYPPTFQPYQHDNLYNSFYKLISFFENVLKNIEESYLTVPFLQEDRVFSLDLMKAWEAKVFVLGAKAQPGQGEEDMARWVQNCVIATDSFVHLARDNRILGARREVVQEVAPLNLTPTRGTVLFLVRNDPQFIKIQETLRLFNISDTPITRPQEIVLFLPNKIKNDS